MFYCWLGSDSGDMEMFWLEETGRLGVLYTLTQMQETWVVVGLVPAPYVEWFQPQTRKITSGYHNYLLKGLNFWYMYCRQFFF